MHANAGEIESDALKELLAPENEPSLFPSEETPAFWGPPLSAFEESKKRQKSPFNHEHIPVFRAYLPLRDAFDNDKQLPNVPREFRYCLVDKIREDLFNIESLISMIWDEEDLEEKVFYLKQARTCCLDMRGRFRSLYSRKLINETRFIHFSDLIVNVASQFKSWLKSTQERLRNEKRNNKS